MIKKNKGIDSFGRSSVFIITIFLGIAFGFIAGFLTGFSLSGDKSSSGGSYEKAMADAKDKLVASGLIGKGEVKALSGPVISAKDEEVVFSAPLPNPLLPDNLKTRTAVISDKTIVVLKKSKSLEQRKKDNQAGSALLGPLEKQAADLKKITSACGWDEAGKGECLEAQTKFDGLVAQISKINEEQMSPTVVYSGKISDLKGQISIVAEAAENISEKQKFEATRVELTEAAEEVAAPPAVVPIK